MRLADWLPDVWAQTRTVRILDGGGDGGPLPERKILAGLADPAQLDRLRGLSTSGRFTGDSCRCLGNLTLALYDVDDRLLGNATVHGHGRISWERAGFADDLEVAEPTALALFLAECGVAGRLVGLFTDLVMALGYYEESDAPQFRPAGVAAALADRQVPEALRAELVGVAGNVAAELPDDRVRELARRLTAAEPDGVARARTLLNWLGRLPFPTEALWGEGVLVRHLLATLPEPVIVAAAAADQATVALGALNWGVHQPDDRVIAAAIAPTLRRLLP
ncbi:hypothetical protein AB0J86_20965 [Micromonospora sp. NPDC049559]|uniref:hypothetical protein n=1 Tax=Micromonospora sp. NPDC049559 TaxID=3155923 RepID=UPI00341E4888